MSFVFLSVAVGKRGDGDGTTAQNPIEILTSDEGGSTPKRQKTVS